MNSSVTFPNSMVDRIVPSGSDRYNEAALAHLGVRDTIAVPAEPFTMWVMEERFAAGRPVWEHGGALFTDDVEPYELMKVRLLNGTHSLIAYLAHSTGAPPSPSPLRSRSSRTPRGGSSATSTCRRSPFPLRWTRTTTSDSCSRVGPIPLWDIAPHRSAPTDRSNWRSASRSPRSNISAAVPSRSTFL